MPLPDWTHGFKIESDGTQSGTRFHDKDNNEVTEDLRRFEMFWDSYKLRVRGGEKYTPPENP